MRNFIKHALIATVLVAGVKAQDANQLLERARLAAALQNTDLRGSIRGGGAKHHVSLFLREENIQFTTGEGNRRFHMRLGDDKAELFEIVGGKQAKFPSSKLSERIAGSDLTYEDLSMRFLYWPNATLLGEDVVDGHQCYKVQVMNPTRSGSYGTMWVWLHKKFGAFMQIEGFDRKGHRIKRFEVQDVMKLPNDTYTLSKMRVSTMSGSKARSHSYLEFDKPTRPQLPRR